MLIIQAIACELSRLVTKCVMRIVGKVFARVLNERVKAQTVNKVMIEQGGFRAGRRCANQVFVVRQVVEKIIEDKLRKRT